MTPGSRGESHPPAPTDPDMNLSAHPALVVLATRTPDMKRDRKVGLSRSPWRFHSDSGLFRLGGGLV